jgi:hypothetical protein
MSRRPAGAEAACEAGLRALAAKRGPSVGRLVAAADHPGDADPELRKLMQRTEAMYGASTPDRATALWEIIQEEIRKIPQNEDDPRCQCEVSGHP